MKVNMPRSSLRVVLPRQPRVVSLPPIIYLLASAITCFAASASDQAGFKRWAIVSTLPARATAIPDLLTAELSSSEDIQLVERDQVEQALRELSVAELFEAKGTATRSRLGQLVGADALICLHADAPASNAESPSMSGLESARGETGQPKKPIRVVITECAQGARLTVAEIEFNRSQPQEAIARIHQLVDDIRHRYADGIQQVVGVPPFISRNLTHEYDHLQTVFAEVLSSAIAGTPGTAVIEFQEAQAIARELQLAGGTEISRQVPAFVEGEYECEIPKNNQKPTVSIRLHVKQAGAAEPRILDFKSAGPAEAIELLFRQGTSLLRPTASGDSVGTQTLSRDDQLKLLKSRAESFARLGSVEQSTDLREAILLLDPNDVEERCSLVREYRSRIYRCTTWKPYGEQPGNDVKNAQRRKALSLCGRPLDILEFLIMNGRISKLDAVALSEQACIDLRYWFDRKNPSNEDLLEKLDLRQREFIKNVYPRILSLSSPEQAQGFRGSPYQAWHDTLFKLAWMHYGATWDTRQVPDYGFLLEVMETLPENEPIPNVLIGFVYGSLSAVPEFQAELVNARAVLYERLAQSKRRAYAYMGRLGLLAVECNRACPPGHPGGDTAALSSVLEKLDALGRDYADLLENDKSSQENLQGVKREVTRMMQKAMPKAPASRPTSRPTSPDLYIDPVFHKKTPLKFQIPDELRKSAATRPHDEHDAPNQPLRVFQCGSSLDVVWKRGFLGLHRTPGIVDVIAFDPAAEFADVAWDGKNAWVATREKGIWLISPNGEILDRIGQEHGLPPADQAIHICALGEGRVVAAGSFGRAWCALIESDQSGNHVRVFHQATHLSLSGDGAAERRANPSRVFNPSYVRLLNDYPKRGQSRIVVGREIPGERGISPLEINPETMQVTVFPWTAPNRYGEDWDIHSVGDGQILASSPHEVYHMAGAGPAFPDGQTAHFLGKSKINHKELVFCNGKYYYMGLTWWRIDPSTMTSEMVYSALSWRIPAVFGTSAHFGLIWYYEWGEDVIFQAIIDGPKRFGTRPASSPAR